MSQALTLSNPKELLGYLTKSKSAIEMALPKHLNPDRMMRLAITAFSTTPKLRECTAQSILGAIVVASQLGLEIGVAGQGWLIPYKNTCTFVPGWQGMVSLLNNTGRATAWTGAVFEGDDFEYSLGSSPKIVHRPGENYGDADKLIWVYACGKVNGSEQPVIEAWPMSRVWKHRDKHNKVGKNHYSYVHPEMYARKVVLLQVLKYMPRSIELNNAIVAADAAEIGNTTKIEDGVVVEVATEVSQDTETKPANITQLPPQDKAKPDTEKTTEKSDDKTAPPETVTDSGEGDPQENLSKLSALLSGISCDEARFLRWLKASKYVTTPLATADEMAEICPKKLNHLVKNFENYKEAISKSK